MAGETHTAQGLCAWERAGSPYSCEVGSLRGCARCCSFMADCIDCGEPVYTKVEKDAEWKATMARCKGCRLAWLSRPGW